MESTRKQTSGTIINQKTVVIADDNDSVRFYYQEILEGLPITLHLFENGQEVLDYIIAYPNADLVLLDIRMPVMDGLEALKKIKQINPQLRVFAQSAFAMDEQIEKFKKEGFEGYFTKPIDEEKILELLNELTYQ